MCSRCSSSMSWYTASSTPPGRTVSSKLRVAFSPAALGSAGYCIDTRSNERAGSGACSASPAVPSHGGGGPVGRRSGPSHRHGGDVDRGDGPPTPGEPDSVGALATADVECPARREVGDLGDEPPVRLPAPHRPVTFAVARIPLG